LGEKLRNVVESGVAENGAYYFKCPYCGKLIKSLYLSQAIYNFSIHVYYCKKRPQGDTSLLQLFAKR
jgi:hypothetical protein